MGEVTNMSEITTSEKEFKIKRLEADASNKIHSNEHSDALNVLEKIIKLDGTDVTKVHTLAMEGLCYMRLKQYPLVNEVVQEIVRVIDTSSVTPNDVIKMARTCKDEDQHTCAYILYYAGCKLLVTKSVGVASGAISLAFSDMASMNEEMATSDEERKVAKNHMVPAMEQIIKGLVASTKNDDHESINHQAWCYFNIGRCYLGLADHQQCIKMNQAGINLLKEKIGSDVDKYRVMGNCYHNIALAYHCLKKEMKEVEEAFKSAMWAKEHADDYANDEQQKRDIEHTKNAREQIRLSRK